MRFSTTSNPHDSSARCSSIVWKISTGRNILTTCDAIPILFRLRILSHIYDMYERIRCEVHPLSVPASPSPTPVVAWAYEYCVPLPDAFRIVLNGDWPSLMLSENRCGASSCDAFHPFATNAFVFFQKGRGARLAGRLSSCRSAHNLPEG